MDNFWTPDTEGSGYPTQEMYLTTLTMLTKIKSKILRHSADKKKDVQMFSVKKRKIFMNFCVHTNLTIPVFESTF